MSTTNTQMELFQKIESRLFAKRRRVFVYDQQRAHAKRGKSYAQKIITHTTTQ
jgi:hypothetical protein